VLSRKGQHRNTGPSPKDPSKSPNCPFLALKIQSKL
jgi:hypothetical protein